MALSTGLVGVLIGRIDEAANRVEAHIQVHS